MKALIVYDSVYGNTEKIAQAVAAALTLSGEVKVLRAGEVNPSEFESVDLLVVGLPTQGGRPTPTIKEFLRKIPANALNNVGVTSFDARIKYMVARLLGYAAGPHCRQFEREGGSSSGAAAGLHSKG